MQEPKFVEIHTYKKAPEEVLHFQHLSIIIKIKDL